MKMETKNWSHVILEILKQAYVKSDVTSGEFIHSTKIPTIVWDEELPEQEIVTGIQMFLDWDESPETFEIMKIGKYWYTTQYNHNDWVEFLGKRYPIRNLTVEHCDLNLPVSYTIAPESLQDAMGEVDEESRINIDSMIYHYVDNAVWHLTGKEIAEKHLDMYFVFIEEN